MVQIVNGVGNGNRMKVDETNRGFVRAIAEDGTIEAAEDGNAYFLTSGAVSLTDAASNGVFYYKHEEDWDAIIDRIIFSAGISTGGTTNLCTVTATINPTGMTSGSGSDLTAINNNFGSNNALDVSSSEAGATGASIAGGTTGPTFYWKDEITTTFETAIVLRKGNSVGFSVAAPASNTSLGVAMTCNLHKALTTGE